MITKERAPLFDLFTVEQLANLTPYSVGYLRDLERRPARIRPHFRKVIARLLGKPENELFDYQGDHASAANGASVGQTPNSEVPSRC